MIRVTLDSQAADPAPPWEISGAIEKLRHLVHQLDASLPDPADGEAWARYDQALGDLHGALVLLESPGGSAGPAVGEPWAGTISRADGPPVRTS